MQVETPQDPRTSPFVLLRRQMAVPGMDLEAKADRRLLRRIDLRAAVLK